MVHPDSLRSDVKLSIIREHLRRNLDGIWQVLRKSDGMLLGAYANQRLALAAYCKHPEWYV